MFAPAPASFLDCAADCIEMDDHIGRHVFLTAHAANVAFDAAPSFETRTELGATSGLFRAKFAGRCAISGQWFAAGADVYRADAGIVALATVRAWEFTRTDGVESSRWARPAESAKFALEAGRMVATLNTSGVKVYWMKRGDKIEEVTCTGGNTARSNRKSLAAWWSTIASKAQAVRVFDAR